MDVSPQPNEAKAKITNGTTSNYKAFYATKETLNKMNKSTEWEKIFANDISDKELISNIYKELIQLNIKKTPQKCEF